MRIIYFLVLFYSYGLGAQVRDTDILRDRYKYITVSYSKFEGLGSVSYLFNLFYPDDSYKYISNTQAITIKCKLDFESFSNDFNSAVASDPGKGESLWWDGKDYNILKKGGLNKITLTSKNGRAYHALSKSEIKKIVHWLSLIEFGESSLRK